jgi:Transcription factor Tfb4
MFKITNASLQCMLLYQLVTIAGSLTVHILLLLQAVFATDLHSRNFLRLPKPVGVDFRASYVTILLFHFIVSFFHKFAFLWFSC